MKKLLTLLALIVTLNASAQIDSIVYNAPNPGFDTLIAYRIDTAVTGGSSDSNMVWVSYHYIQTTGDSFLYQPQLIVYDSANVQVIPNIDMMGIGWLAGSGTVKGWYIDSITAQQSPDSLRTLYVLPDFKGVFGNNVTKL